MTNLRFALPLIALLAAVPAGGEQARTARPAAAVGESGVIAGAPYRIDIPAGWNGGLVVFFHGYRPANRPAETPYRGDNGTDQFTRRGYAVIQSGYARQGWAVAEARADTRRLRAAFEQRFGRPRQTFVAGFSMGGHLALATIEQEHQRYDGALSLCGVTFPATEMIDRIVDNLAAADALFPGVIPDLAAPDSPPQLDGEALQRAMAADPAAAARIAEHMGLRAANLPGTIWFYYLIVRELRERAGGFPGTNAAAPALNSGYRRYRFDPAARAYLAAHATLTGRLRDPVVILDNAYDDLLAARYRDDYAADVAARGARRFLTVLPPSGEGHCRFDPAAIGTAFDRLVAAVDARGRR